MACLLLAMFVVFSPEYFSHFGFASIEILSKYVYKQKLTVSFRFVLAEVLDI